MVIKRDEKLSKQVEEDPQEILVYFDGGMMCKRKKLALVYVCIIKKEIQTTGFAAMHI